MKCPEPEVLSAYADREASPEERGRVERHLAGCPACRTSLSVLVRLKDSVRLQPDPPMPAALRAALDSMAAEIPRAEVVAWRESLFAGWIHLRPAWGLGLAAAGVALLAWSGGDRDAENVPLDLILAAHRQYALTLPLAETESILSQLPGLMARADAEDPRDR